MTMYVYGNVHACGHVTYSLAMFPIERCSMPCVTQQHHYYRCYQTHIVY